MGKLKILAGGASQQAQAQARGKLFEKLMAQVLRHYRYNIDRIASVNYAGMEIDIEGKHTLTNIPMYAECKCYETEIKAPQLTEFFGKYMSMWFNDRRAHGLFIALPGVNTHAKGLYREKYEANTDITMRLYEEDDVLEALFQTELTIRPETISSLITPDMGVAGDWVLLYTEKGLLWEQYVIPIGGAIPNGIALFDATGRPLTDRATLDYLLNLDPELNDFGIVTVRSDTPLPMTFQTNPEVEAIAEVNGSSTCFEYQFPASPEHFVGRQSILRDVDDFSQAIVEKQTSSRSILFQADSGLGKSSVVLASVALLREKGHFAVSIDSRSASSSQFILRAISYSLDKFGSFEGLLPDDKKPGAITGFDGAINALLGIGEILEQERKVLFIFLDQFENVFFLPDVLRRVRDLLLKVADARSNIAFGFAWKTDLFGSINNFPFQTSIDISSSSKCISLDRFSEEETSALLRKLSRELRAPVRKDLQFFLREFSQGYPWLLKKLCSHVKSQREAGVQQADMANSLLNVEQLFQEDLHALRPDQEDTLRRIARRAPISALELGEEFNHDIVQSLVYARFIIRIGNKYDVYWDIFKDYLNSGRVPVQENYVLQVEMGSVLKAAKMLTEADGALSKTEFQQEAGLSEKSFYNLVHDLRFLGLAKMDGEQVRLQVRFAMDRDNFEDTLNGYVREKLRRNRLVWQVLKELDLKAFEVGTPLTLDEVADILEESSPYTRATKETWRTYARRFANWMDAVNLAIFDSKHGTLDLYKPDAKIHRSRPLTTTAKRNKDLLIPLIQYSPIEKVALLLAKFTKEGKPIDWMGLDIKKSTLWKALTMLEAMGFISKHNKTIEFSQEGQEFATNPEKRLSLFTQSALKIESFKAFIEILEALGDTPQTLPQLAEALKAKIGIDWKDETAKVYIKIMLDWARHIGQAPTFYQRARTGLTQEKQPAVAQYTTVSLFSDILDEN